MKITNDLYDIKSNVYHFANLQEIDVHHFVMVHKSVPQFNTNVMWFMSGNTKWFESNLLQ